MKIQYASDLHLEFAENRNFIENEGIMPMGEILVLAGDVSYLCDRKMMKRRFSTGVRSISERPLSCWGTMSFITGMTSPGRWRITSSSIETMCGIRVAAGSMAEHGSQARYHLYPRGFDVSEE